MTKWKSIDTGSKSENDEHEDDFVDTNEDGDYEDDEDGAEDEDDTESYRSGSDDSDEDLDESEEDSDEDDLSDDDHRQEDDEKPSKKQSGTRAETRIRELANRSRDFESRAEKAERELSELRQQNAVLFKNSKQSELLSVDSNIKEIESKLTGIRAKLLKANEAGDYEAVADAQDELTEHRVALTALKSSKSIMEDDLKKVPKVQETESTNTQKRDVAEIVRKWGERNNSWFNKDHAMTGAALGINAQLVREGFDDKSAEFYKELDKRMAKSFPTKLKSKQSNDKTPQRKVARSPVDTGSRVSNRSDKGDPRLSAQERNIAETLGIDAKEYKRYAQDYENNQRDNNSTFKPILMPSKGTK